MWATSAPVPPDACCVQGPQSPKNVPRGAGRVYIIPAPPLANTVPPRARGVASRRYSMFRPPPAWLVINTRLGLGGEWCLGAPCVSALWLLRGVLLPLALLLPPLRFLPRCFFVRPRPWPGP